MTLFPWLVIIGFWIFLFRQMQAGGSRAFSFGKSKAKLLTGDTPKVTFVDVAGCDEAKVELQEIIEFLRSPKKFQRLGGRIPDADDAAASGADGRAGFHDAGRLPLDDKTTMDETERAERDRAGKNAVTARHR